MVAYNTKRHIPVGSVVELKYILRRVDKLILRNGHDTLGCLEMWKKHTAELIQTSVYQLTRLSIFIDALLGVIYSGC